MKAILLSFLLMTPALAQEPMFVIPNVNQTVQARRDKEIRWYSSREAPSAFTASGQLLCDSCFTFASRDLPLGTRIRVTYKGKSACFRCNDRGPNHVEITLGGFAFFDNPDIGVLKGAKIEILYD